MTWLWIPITVAAAFMQNARTVVQRQLKGVLSNNGAAFTRFVYGAPLVFAYVLVLRYGLDLSWPEPDAAFWAWTLLGSLTQVVATSLLLLAVSLRNFAVGVAYSKTEVLQAALFELLALGTVPTLGGAAAMVIATAGVMLLSLKQSERPWRAFFTGWTERAALIGLASGGMFAVSAVSYRAASVGLGHPSFIMAAGFTLGCALAMQTTMMGAYLAWREPGELPKVARSWRLSSLAGLTGALGSAGWFTAFTLTAAANVRTLALVELLFTYLSSILWFKERPSRNEVLGLVLIVAGIALLLNAR